MKINRRMFILALLAIGIGIGMFHVFMIPPFQGPDEVQHFLYSASFAYDKPTMENVEAETLRLLKEYKWFHFVGIGPGWENTKSISDISFVFHFDVGKKSARKTIFHFVYGNILKITGIKDVLTAFYFMRILSGFFYLVVLFLALLFFKTHFPGRWPYFFAGLILVFQLGTILNSVNYDVFMILLGSLFFVYSYRYLAAEEGKKSDLALLIVFAGVSVLTKLVGMMFFVYLVILLFMRLKPGVEWNRRWMTYTGLAFLLLITGFCWLNYLFPARLFNLYTQVFRVLEDFAASLTSSGAKAPQTGFFHSIADSFYFYSGWMGFKLSGAWYIIIKIYLFISAVGLVLAAISKKIRAEIEGKQWLLYSIIALALHTLSIWLYYGHHPFSQGRYMYPLAIPIVFIVYTGLTAVEKWLRLKKNVLVISFILFQALLWVFAAARVISVYYLEIASPHAGL